MRIDECPFCGSKNVHISGRVVEGWVKEIEIFMYVSCKNCGAKGPEQKCTPDDMDLCEENAIKAWNKRK